MKINHASRLTHWFNTALLFILILLVIQGGAAQASPARVAASTPQVISYQGVVTVSGQPFNGSGQFKFAIVDAVGATYWSNDGNLSGQPSTAVTLAVNKGLFNVLLGDTNLPGMTSSLGADVFSTGERYLRVWFSPDGKTYTQLTPDQRIASVPYALVAENAKTLNGQPASAFAASDHTHPAELPSGAMVLGAPGDTNLTGAGFETWDMSNITCSKCGGWVGILPGSRGLTKRIDQRTVWTGSEMIIWGGNDGEAFYNDGARYNPINQTWATLPPSGLTGRSNHSAVWTGSEMIVWGGFNHNTMRYFNDGARYNPETQTWTPLPPSGLAERTNHTAVVASTPQEIIIWGGTGTSGIYNDGAIYSSINNAWTSLPDSGLSPRLFNSAVWTGTEMIIWGGFDGASLSSFSDGARYNVFTNAWTPMSKDNAPAARSGHTAIWTGSEMIIWGGGSYEGGSFKTLINGASYNPTTDTWTPLPDSPINSRTYHNAVWTGTEMIIWGGANADGLFNDGASYNPTTRVWAPMSTSGAPTARCGSSAVWTGSKMLIWGGYDGHGSTNDGAIYDTHLAIYRKP